MINGKLLIVDDEQNLLELLSEFAAESIDQVETCLNPVEALEKMKNGIEYDVVLSDIKMPQLDGVTFMEEALKIDPELTFMFMSGFPDRETISKALKMGAYDFLEKPFTLNQLGHTLNRAFELKNYKTRLHELLELIVFEYMDDLPYDKFIDLPKNEKIEVLDKLLSVLRLKHAAVIQNND